MHWERDGTVLRAIDYVNPPGHGEPGVHHVLFVALQVVMIVPEEAIGDHTLIDRLHRHRPAAMFDRGQSEWLKSFSQRHLQRCHHYQLLFYDHLIEAIAEGVDVGRGGFKDSP